jgi:adenylyltransferase/sulfurtransferase
VLVVGVGATGGAAADLLARAGVGHLTLIDRDFPEWSNLQRQSLLVEEDVRRRRPKAVAAEARLRAIDSGLSVTSLVSDLHAGNALALAEGHDLIIDGTDNFATRFVLNDVAVRMRIPWVYAGVIGAAGALLPVPAGGQPCLRCLYPAPPGAGEVETCDTAGVLGPAVAVVGGQAALAGMRFLLGDPPAARLTWLELWAGETRAFDVPADPECATCGLREFPALAGEAGGGDAVAAALCGRDAVHVRPSPTRLDPHALAERLRGVTGAEVLAVNEHLLRWRLPVVGGDDTVGQDSLEPTQLEMTVFADGRAIIQGTEDTAQARAVYARWIGG